MFLYITATLGSPRADCAYFGVCTVGEISPQEWDAFQPLHLRHLKAQLGISAEGGLLFRFSSSGLDPTTRATHFPESGFRVDDPLVLPDSICRSLFLPPGTQLKPGLYPVGEVGDTLEVGMAVATAFVDVAA